MVGEFPELQGVMGGYYARHDGEDRARRRRGARPLRAEGPDRRRCRPRRSSIAVALADKLDQLAAFFAIGEKPTGSGDPYALRRAALGVIRIIRENGLRLPLLQLFHEAAADLPAEVPSQALLDFIADRLRVQLRAEGARHDVLAAVFAAGADDDLVRLLARTEAVAALLGTRGRRRPARRLSPRRQHPAHRGQEGRPASTARSIPRSLQRAGGTARSTPRSTHAEAAIARASGARGFRRRDGGAGASSAPRLDAFFDQVTVNAAGPGTAPQSAAPACPRRAPRWTAPPTSPESKAEG